MFHFGKDFHFNDYAELTVSHALQAFATSMVGVFIPIYLLNIGFSINQVLLILGLQNFFYLFHVLLAPRIVKRIGVKHSMFFRGPVVILNLLLLYHPH